MNEYCKHCRRELELNEDGLCDSCETQDAYDRAAEAEIEEQLKWLRPGTLVEVIADAYRPEPEGLGLTGRIFTQPTVSQATGEVCFGVKLEVNPSGTISKIVRARNARIVQPRPGDRVELKHDVDRYPHFIAPKGARGTVVDIGDDRILAVKLDEQLDGAEEWDNEVHWFDDLYSRFYLDAGVIDNTREDR